jgi:hypothetical protein
MLDVNYYIVNDYNVVPCCGPIETVVVVVEMIAFVMRDEQGNSDKSKSTATEANKVPVTVENEWCRPDLMIQQTVRYY